VLAATATATPTAAPFAPGRSPASASHGSAPAAVAIACRGLHKRFGTVQALAGADLEVEGGTLTAVIGPSGCGKTTLLRTIAGFEVPEAGEIEVGGRLMVGGGAPVPPRKRGIGMVFQDYALFPHMDVAANVGYALGRRPDPRRVAAMLDVVGLDGMGDRRPHELSGGQQQRVALARALVARPAVVLLDEPFSNLDAALRAQVRAEVRAILADAGVSALLVTHDQEEALSLADRVVVMRAGRAVQAGTPDDVYRRPANRWVAGFLGAVEVLRGEVTAAGVDTPLGPVPGVDGPPPGDADGVEVLVRPECIGMVHAGVDAPAVAVPGTVVGREYFGHDQLVTVALADGTRLRHRGGGDAMWRRGDDVRLWISGPATVVAAEPAATPDPSGAPAGSTSMRVSA